MGHSSLTIEQLEGILGERLRESRLSKNLTQQDVADRAGVHVSLVRRLEGGAGSTLKTFIAIVKALGQEDWLQTVAPVSINPFHQVEHRERLRASKRARRVE